MKKCKYSAYLAMYWSPLSAHLAIFPPRPCRTPLSMKAVTCLLANRCWLRDPNQFMYTVLCTGCYRKLLCPEHIPNTIFSMLLLNPSSPVVANHEISTVCCAPATADMLRRPNRSPEVRAVDSCRSGRSRR